MFGDSPRSSSFPPPLVSQSSPEIPIVDVRPHKWRYPARLRSGPFPPRERRSSEATPADLCVPKMLPTAATTPEPPLRFACNYANKGAFGGFRTQEMAMASRARLPYDRAGGGLARSSRRTPGSPSPPYPRVRPRRKPRENRHCVLFDPAGSGRGRAHRLQLGDERPRTGVHDRGSSQPAPHAAASAGLFELRCSDGPPSARTCATRDWPRSLGSSARRPSPSSR